MSLVSGNKKQQAKAASKVKAANPIARWGTYEIWKVTPDSIYLFDDVSMSREWVAKQTTGSGKKKKTVKAHKGPVEFDFKFALHKELQPEKNLAKEIRNWNARVGKAAPFYIGTTAFGVAKKYRLVGVDIADVQQVRGIIVACTVTLHFKMTKSKAVTSEKKQWKKAIRKKSAKKKAKLNKKRTG